jgi:DNA-binding CsgD family transcriptional regulator
MTSTPEPVQHAPQLTPRQAEVIQLAAAGLSDKEIGRYLGLSTRTVRQHFTAARQRWDVATRARLIALAVAPEWGVLLSNSDDQGHAEASGCDTGLQLPLNRSCSENYYFRTRSSSGTRDSSLMVPARAPRDRGRPTVMTPDRIEAARELLRDHTITEVARKLGVGRTTLHKYLPMINAAAT